MLPKTDVHCDWKSTAVVIYQGIALHQHSQYYPSVSDCYSREHRTPANLFGFEIYSEGTPEQNSVMSIFYQMYSISDINCNEILFMKMNKQQNFIIFQKRCFILLIKCLQYDAACWFGFAAWWTKSVAWPSWIIALQTDNFLTSITFMITDNTWMIRTCQHADITY